MDMDKHTTRTTGGWSFTIHVAVNAYAGERYVDIASASDGVMRQTRAYLTEQEAKELIEALKETLDEG